MNYLWPGELGRRRRRMTRAVCKQLCAGQDVARNLAAAFITALHLHSATRLSHAHPDNVDDDPFKCFSRAVCTSNYYYHYYKATGQPLSLREPSLFTARVRLPPPERA